LQEKERKVALSSWGLAATCVSLAAPDLTKLRASAIAELVQISREAIASIVLVATQVLSELVLRNIHPRANVHSFATSQVANLAALTMVVRS
jgi:hypothetical protein